MTALGGKQWLVITGDSRRVLRDFGEDSVDHVITDPPYSRGLYLRFRSNSRARLSPTLKARGQRAVLRTSSLAYQQLADLQIGASDDVVEYCAPLFPQLAKRWVLVFHDAESGHLWRDGFGASYTRAGVWVKTNPVPQISGDRPAQGFEALSIAHRPGRKHWNGGGKPAVWRHTALNGNFHERAATGGHPCPKPLLLMRELIEQFTDPGDVVLDPFCGSGSTLVAALELGRRAIGIERNPKFANTARRRCAVATQEAA